MLLENKQVAIIGGGPGGLTLARLLQLKGVPVKVYERDLNREVRVQGATLDLHQGSGLKAMEKAGLMDAFKATYRPGADKGRVVDEHAHILFDEHDSIQDEDFSSETFRPEIDRGPLRDMLLDSLEPGTVVWDSHFITMLQVGDVWELTFKNGTTATADIVIGADGANSRIRPFVTAVQPFYSGVTIVQGNVDNAATVVPGIDQLLQGGKLYAFSGGKYLHVSAKGDGSLQFYTSFRTAEDWVRTIDFNDRAQVLAWFKEAFKEWDHIWLSLCENASLPLLPRPQYCIPANLHWDALPNVTLLGDAAHIMPPSGEGVNLAMLDAVELSECLTNGVFNDMQTAIAAYEQSMLARGVEEARESLAMIEWMHGDDALAKMMQMLQPA
ncbi:FAD-dependent oxidoreductase [Deminuibacter soli]|uniref:Flavin-dependent monooxygenase n=1 Tax=Deminuibacter soli TaxID=2291815 RepID=A0A3E1NEP7_9BACT|nr:NAD(P)/FAD-dependent oxidoreductase [Deminuibacter soli]RFM26453.1 FAD-dependent monooxygenase [Deminuibacter soli]